MNNCHNYNIKWWHIIAPPFETILKLCSSYDKTYLFIIAFIRFILFTIIFTALYLNKFKIWKLFYVVFILQLIILLLTTIKTTIYNIDEPNIQREIDFKLLTESQQQTDIIDDKQNKILNLLNEDTVDPDVIRLEVIRSNY